MKKKFLAAFLLLSAIALLLPSASLSAQQNGDVQLKYKMVATFVNPCIIKMECTNIEGDQCSHKGSCFYVSWCILF